MGKQAAGRGRLDIWESLYGRKISNVLVRDDTFRLSLADGETLRLSGAEGCCQALYFVCDDEISKIVGGRLRRIELKPIRSTSVGGYAPGEQAFLEIGTDECFITVRAHKDHNGSCGGVCLRLSCVRIH